MMSLRSIETKHLINKGFEPARVTNPFIYYMWQKNEFKLGSHITSIGAAFYIVPFVNAMVRSGTQNEKELLFNSMLYHKAFEKVPSDKRGHKGEMVPLVEEAILIANRVKKRQTDAQDAGMAFIEKMIEENNMLDHKVLLFLLKPGQIDRNIAGLIANKIMAKYQRPTCILTEVKESYFEDDGESVYTSYQGSARGYSKSGIESFKKVCEETGLIMYASGHDNAFGLGIEKDNINNFIEKTDELLKDMTSEAVYYVDYIYTNNEVDGNQILEVAGLDSLWGQDVDEALVALDKLKVSKEMVTVYRKKNNTLKIHLQSGVDIMLFDAPDDLCEELETSNLVNELNIVGTCNANEWCGNVTPQIFIKDYEKSFTVPFF